MAEAIRDGLRPEAIAADIPEREEAQARPHRHGDATVIMGKGATATLRLKRPASVSRTRDLVYVKSARGTKHTSTLTRDAKGILVKIAPS